MKVGWIGTGIMGSSMAGHLLGAGHALWVHSRTRVKARDLEARGAAWCGSPAAVAAQCEILFTMVGFPADVEQVYFAEDGVLAARPACRIVIDMTTTRPALAREIARRGAEFGIRSLDAPVSGGDVGARNASLAIMAGGDRSAFDEALPLFQALGKNIACMGAAGAGQHTKLCNQILIAGTMIATCEALLYAERQGLDAAAVIDIVEKGAAGSWTLSHLGRRMTKGDFAPGFYVEHFVKDLDIALEEAKRGGLTLPGLDLARRLYERAVELGHGRSGTQALLLALRELNAG